MDLSNFSTDDLIKLNQIHKKRKILLLDIENLENEYKEITLQMKKLGCIIDGRIEEPKTRHLRIGKNKFNINSEEGLNYLITEKVLQRTPSCIAKFLFENTLDKVSVGNYLGNISNSLNNEVLDEYISLYDFIGLEFVDALRLFLNGFHLPGESQKIDKIVILWSKRFHQHNPEYFKDESEAYIMTFAVIMLNTCLYNPTAKRCNGGFGKEEDFTKIMTDFDTNTHFDLALVKNVFKNIKAQPLLCDPRMKNDAFVNKLHNIEKSGWLLKLGGRIKNLKKRWFVLCNNCLYYFFHPNSQSLKGLIPLVDVMIQKLQGKPGKYGFEIYTNSNSLVKACKSEKDGKVELGHHITYKMYCNSDFDLYQWIEAIEKCINTHWQLRLLQSMD